MATSSAWRGRVWQEPINEYGNLNVVSEFNQGFGECTFKKKTCGLHVFWFNYSLNYVAGALPLYVKDMATPD